MNINTGTYWKAMGQIFLHNSWTENLILLNLKTLFNIVEERLKKLLNFDVSAV